MDPSTAEAYLRLFAPIIPADQGFINTSLAFSGCVGRLLL